MQSIDTFISKCFQWPLKFIYQCGSIFKVVFDKQMHFGKLATSLEIIKYIMLTSVIFAGVIISICTSILIAHLFIKYFPIHREISTPFELWRKYQEFWKSHVDPNPLINSEKIPIFSIREDDKSITVPKKGVGVGLAFALILVFVVTTTVAVGVVYIYNRN